MNNRCSLCGRENVKLWRPFKVEEKPVPLICASCAEKNQLPYSIKGKLEYWRIDKEGKIGKSGSLEKTFILRVTVPEKKKINSLEDLDWIPAYIDKEGKCYVNECIPVKFFEEWKNLETR